MKMNKEMTKRQYIKWNKKVLILIAVMLLGMSGCAKKQEETSAEPTPVITEIPDQDNTELEETESDTQEETEEPKEEPKDETESEVQEDAAEEEENAEIEEDKEHIQVTPEQKPEEDFTEEDPVETIVPEGEVLTKEQAVAAVAAFSKEALGLQNELGQYSIIVDSWTTMVQGNECYCLNVYDYVDDKQQLVKMLYVTVDGKEVFVHDDELGKFVQITK
ncbi:MAG: hypothetical protein E7256_01440 [Lachnospiraceae bacterium]|nr:hypothetical protein [Lachnospiraceae bacterium]